MSRLKDMTGQRIGRLVVIKRVDDIVETSGRHRAAWECKCDCGNTIIVRGESLRKKNHPTRSCGCYAHDVEVESHTTHGGRRTKLYAVWCSMRSRCNNKNDAAYKNYGGRGIKVCEEWCNSFESFRDWALNAGYSETLTIDRIDNNGNYCPDNCRWVDRTAQANNRRSNRYITYNGKTQTLTQWSNELGKNAKTLFNRLYAGMDKAEILST